MGAMPMSACVRLSTLALVLALAGCAPSPARAADPEVQVERIRLLSFTSADARLELTLSVSNPTGVPLRVDTLDATLSLDAQKVADVVLPHPIQVAALTPTSVTLDVRADPESTLRVVAGALARGAPSVAYELVGVAIDGTGGRWPFARRGEIGRAQLAGRRA